ncbi:MAG: Ribosomal RNA small subunit methyltransferase I [Chlamydiae bacterium]|nr:Ribosomal RNA small subunit methyltransferase I [Chlamydiota bacterium]
MLYLVATPIGNLDDISYRAVETLKSCDYILCEDTRHSKILLNHYGISKPLKSFHQFSEAYKEKQIIQDLNNGKNIALISDAGTPGISDPGERLVKRCREEELDVTAIPGACAAIVALSSSGFDTRRFQFLGFLPRKMGELKQTLLDVLRYPGTSICYESPKRVEKVLQLLKELAPERVLTIARELTKKFEEMRQGNAEELLTYFASHPLKGEIVILFSESLDEALIKWEKLTPEEHVKELQDTYHLTKKEAIKLAAELRGIPKRNIYQQVSKS